MEIWGESQEGPVELLEPDIRGKTLKDGRRKKEEGTIT